MPWLSELKRNITGTLPGPRDALVIDQPEMLVPAPELLLPEESPEPVEEEPQPQAGLRLIEDEFSDRRSAPRYEAEVAGRLQLPTIEHDCRVVDVSTGGMSVFSEEAMLMPGMQVAVLTQTLPALIGSVRWHRPDGMFGVQFTRTISQATIEKMGRLKRRIRTPRAHRVKLELPCVVQFNGAAHPVIVTNIAVGGLLMIDQRPAPRGKRRVIRRGQPLMIHFPDMLPIGGHVRWTCGTKIGAMFTRLLPLAMAEDLQRMCDLPSAWVEEVRQAHADLAGTEQTEEAEED